MRLLSLRLENLRCIERAELELGPGLNWLVGPNGAGKTSVLEAIALLASGRSFRGGAVDAVVRRGSDACHVFTRIADDLSGRETRLGLSRQRRNFEARIDGERVDSLAALFERCPAVCVEPDSGSLISGPGELRRRFLDWGLFHVEPSFLPLWRRYQRVLRQRNTLLRARRLGEELSAWTAQLAELGSELHELRQTYLEALRAPLTAAVGRLLPAAGELDWRYRPGWPAAEHGLAEALLEHRDTDLRLGFTGLGPHRAGWTVGFSNLPPREQFSRGQAKLVALAVLLAQVAHFTSVRGQSPVVCLDDVMAELDNSNQVRLTEWLQELGIQALLTAADPALLSRLPEGKAHVFHVEQGVVGARL